MRIERITVGILTAPAEVVGHQLNRWQLADTGIKTGQAPQQERKLGACFTGQDRLILA